MRLIVAGGREYLMKPEDFEKLDKKFVGKVTEVVSGAAGGVDRGGEHWAYGLDIPVKQFWADWKTYGKAAGPIRNRQMAEYADAVVLFPGGRGTQSMYSEAKKAGLEIYDWRNDG